MRKRWKYTIIVSGIPVYQAMFSPTGTRRKSGRKVLSHMKDNAYLRWLSGENEFITFGSCNRTLDQFVNDGWNVLKSISLA